VRLGLVGPRRWADGALGLLRTAHREPAGSNREEGQIHFLFFLFLKSEFPKLISNDFEFSFNFSFKTKNYRNTNVPT
jgi:hypothetical protein